MKTEINKNGWIETTVKKITITSISEKHFVLNKEWIDYNNKYGDPRNKRQSCNCCRKKWEDSKSDVYMAVTNKGNKAICKCCTEKIKELSD